MKHTDGCPRAAAAVSMISIMAFGAMMGGSLTLGAMRPTLAQPAPAGPSEFTLTLNREELATLDRALLELPKRIADPLIAKLQGQLVAQITAAQKAAEAAKAEQAKPEEPK